MVPRNLLLKPKFSHRYLTEASLNLTVCLHLFIISERVFKVFFFSCAFFRMASFSVRHKSHLRVPHRYGKDLVSIDHDTRGVSPSSFSCQTYLERLDSLRLYDFSKLQLWFLYLSFHGGSVAPVYNFSSFASPALTVALYVIAGCKHSPANGHSFLRLQLQSFSLICSFDLFNIFLLWFRITVLTLAVQL